MLLPNAADAVALAREVSVVKNPVPSARCVKMRRPAASTMLTVWLMPSSAAFVWMALAIAMALASVIMFFPFLY